MPINYERLAMFMVVDDHLVRNQTYKLKTYKMVLNGKEACAWLQENGFAKSVAEAVDIGNELIQLGILSHSFHQHSFKNQFLFYKFNMALIEKNQADRSIKATQALEEEVRRLSERVGALEANNMSIEVVVLVAGILMCAMECVSFLFTGYVKFTLILGLTTLLIFQLKNNRRTHNKIMEEREEDEQTSGTVMQDTNYTADVATMRSALAETSALILDESLYPDLYLRSVMIQKSSKDPTRQRTFEYCKDKFIKMLEWKMAFNKLPRQPTHELDCCRAGSLYWHGYDAENRPILWVRSQLKDWKHLNVKDEVAMHVAVIDAMIRGMLPDSVGTFVVIADASNLGIRQISVSLMKELLQLLLTAYPDRLHRLYAGPVNQAINLISNLLMSTMPKRLSQKICITKSPYQSLTRDQVLDASKMPDFLGGTFSHAFEPPANFSFEAMVERNRKMREEIQSRDAIGLKEKLFSSTRPKHKHMRSFRQEFTRERILTLTQPTNENPTIDEHQSEQ